MEYNLADLFESVVDAVPDREALYVEGRRLTYRDLDGRANRLAHHLADRGVGPGDHVGCHLRNGSEYLETMLACFKLRAVPINVNYRYVEDELAYLYDDADLVATVIDDEFTDRLAAVADDLEGLRHALVVGARDPSLPVGAAGFDAAVADRPADRRGLPERSADDLMMIYTGGTTGLPKGVMWRHEDIFFAGMGGGYPAGEPVRSPEEVASRAADNDVVVTFPAPPLMHGAAELGSFIGLLTGGKVVLIRDYTGHGALRLVEQEDVLTMTIVGDAMALPLVDALDEGDYDTSSLLAIGSAGAVLSQTVRDQLTDRLPQVVINDSFGASEVGYTGSQAEGSSPESGLRFEPRNEDTAVITDDLRLAEPGEVGRVAQRGHIPLGYYDDPDKTAETFVEVAGDRWVLLCDRARLDEDGVLHFLGRGSVCINSGGENIYPEEVEAALKSHPAVADAVVAGVPDERWGERVGAVVAPTDDHPPPGLDELAEHLEDRVARYKHPRSLAVVPEVERSPSGKPDYAWARETLETAGT